MTYSLNTLTDTGPVSSGKHSGGGRFAHEFALVAGFAAIVFWLLALVSYSPFDSAFSTSGAGGPLRNWGGRLGAWAADGSYFLFGFSAWWCVAAAIRTWLSTLARWMRDEPRPDEHRFSRTRIAFWIGLAVLLAASCALEWSRLYRFEGW